MNRPSDCGLRRSILCWMSGDGVAWPWPRQKRWLRGAAVSAPFLAPRALRVARLAARSAQTLGQLAQAFRCPRPQSGRRSVAEAGYSLQANRKTREGTNPPDRDAQFRYINDRVKAALDAGEQAISVDTKKKELVGDFKNAGREWTPKGEPEEVRVHDFIIPELGRAAPYGVYDIGENAGWVSVGVDHDTASFAVNAIRRWWLLIHEPRTGIDRLTPCP